MLCFVTACAQVDGAPYLFSMYTEWNPQGKL